MPQREPLTREECLSAIASAREQKPTTAATSTSDGSGTRSSTKPELSECARRSLWESMGDVYGHRWGSSYGADPDGRTARTWAKGLADIHPGQLAVGIRACVKAADGWPPSLPEFRALCLSIPALHAVRGELLSRGSERTPFGLLVWQHLDTYRWRHADAREADRILREAYDAAKQHVMGGGALPKMPAGAIEQQAAEPPKPADPEKVRQHLAELAAILNQGNEDEDQANREP